MVLTHEDMLATKELNEVEWALKNNWFTVLTDSSPGKCRK